MIMNLRHFKIEEFDCSHTGENQMKESFLLRLDELRERCGFPFVITSGYRSKSHPIESKKTNPGKHTEGMAADIKVIDGIQRYSIVEHAIAMGFKGIGVDEGFIHVDDRNSSSVIWTY